MSASIKRAPLLLCDLWEMMVRDCHIELQGIIRHWGSSSPIMISACLQRISSHSARPSTILKACRTSRTCGLMRAAEEIPPPVLEVAQTTPCGFQRVIRIAKGVTSRIQFDVPARCPNPEHQHMVTPLLQDLRGMSKFFELHATCRWGPLAECPGCDLLV